MSVWTRAISPATTIVTAPRTAARSWIAGASSKRTWVRAIRYTPAVTIVAAWMSAETGVGPSIASGSHVCSGSWADFPHAPMNSSSAIPVAVAGAGEGKRGDQPEGGEHEADDIIGVVRQRSRTKSFALVVIVLLVLVIAATSY